MPKLVMMLRVKDGQLFIQYWLNNVEKLVDEIVVVDNGSVDGTYELLKSHPKVVDIVRTEGFNEGRDKILLYNMAKKRRPDWCIWLDVDEIFEERVNRRKLEKMMNNKFINMYMFRRFAMHGDLRHFEAGFKDLLETALFSRQMWRMQKETYFTGSFIHDGSIKGVRGLKWFSNLRIKHLAAGVPGYKEYREKRYKEYMQIDPDESRNEIYKRNLKIELDDRYPTWKWYEFNERPFWVCAQISFFNALMIAQVIIRNFTKLLKAIFNILLVGFKFQVQQMN